MKMKIPSRAVAVAVAALSVASTGTASGNSAFESKSKSKNFITLVGTQKFGKTGNTLRQEIDCPKGWFALNGGYLTSGIVVSTVKNFAVRHPDGWVAEVFAPPAPPPFAPMDDISLNVKVDCAKGGVPLVLPSAAASRALAAKSKRNNYVTVVGPVKNGKSGDTLRQEVHCPTGFVALTGGYVASGIIISTWENFPVRHPDGWVAEIFAPPNGPFGPAQDISLQVKVDCARAGIPVVLPIGKSARAKKNYVTVYAPKKTGKSGEKVRNVAECPKGWFAFNGGAEAHGALVATWASFPTRRPDGWVAEIFAPPAGPFAPIQDTSLEVKVDCAKAGISIVLPVE